MSIVPLTAASFEAGFTLYRARLDKGYSLTDCIAIGTMRNGRIAEVLTNDVHFEQECLSPASDCMIRRYFRPFNLYFPPV